MLQLSRDIYNYERPTAGDVARAPVPAQGLLSFSFPAERNSWLVQPGVGAPVALQMRLHEHGAVVRLVDGSPDTEAVAQPGRLVWEVDLRVRPPVSLTGSSQSPVPVTLFDHPAGDAEPLDAVFQKVVEVAAQELGPQRCPPGEGATDTPIVRALREVQRHVRAVMVPAARAAAARFLARCGSLRWDVYQMAANDPSGRVAQLAATCPGVLLLARSLGPERNRLRDELAALIVGGAKRGEIVAAVVAAWGLATGAAAQTLPSQRRRVLLAGPRVDPEWLWAGPAGEVIPEDIPRRARANGLWFFVQTVAQPIAENLGPRQQRAFRAFVSRHGLAIFLDACRRGPGWRWGSCEDTMLDAFVLRRSLANLIDYLLYTERCPGRKTRPERLLAESERWHVEGRFLADDLQLDQPLAPGPTAGFATWSNQDWTIEFIATVGDLLCESFNMKHCVVSHTPQAIAGEVQIFRAYFGSEAVTIEIACQDGAPVVRQAKGIDNREPGPEARRVIARWLADLGRHVAGQTQAGERQPLASAGGG